MKGTKSKVNQAISGQNSIEDNKYPYSNSIENAVLSDKDIDIYGSKREQNLGVASKYNKSKSIAVSKIQDN